MEKLKSKSTYIFIAVASLSFMVFYFRLKFRRLMQSKMKKSKMIQEVVQQMQSEQHKKYSDDFLSMVKKSHEERANQILAFSKYGHRHK